MSGLTVLVPLDGTPLAESAISLLPLAKSLGFEKVKLVSVWERSWAEEQLGLGNKELKELAERGHSHVGDYLNAQAERVRHLGFAVEAVVRTGRAAEEVLSVASQDSADLILIATHGRDGLARWRLGSVADKVVRMAGCPTLVIGPNVAVDMAPYSCRRILVPLDGSPLAQEALTIATWVAERTGAELDLAQAVTPPPVDRAMGPFPIDILSAMEDSARIYLTDRARDLAGKVEARTAVLIGSAPEQLLQYASQNAIDLVIVASHGRAGVARAVLGSVTDRLLHGPSPVLVLRPEEVRSGLVEVARAHFWRSHVHRIRRRQPASTGPAGPVRQTKGSRRARAGR
jgi:nucleotide-binding universal stress UspA family protein